MRRSSSDITYCFFLIYGLICLTLPPSVTRAGTSEISEPFAGVRHIHRTLTVPRLLDIHVVEIDLAAQGIGFRVTPASPHSTGETVRQTTRAFLNQQKAQVAINGSFSIFLGGQTIIKGIAASDGNVYSPFEYPPEEPWPVLNLSATNEASIHDRNSAGGIAVLPPVPLYNALSGSERIVTAGINTSTVLGWGAPDTLQPRTAAGITADQKLLLVTVDGRNTGHSLGMTTSELANLLIGFGAVDAINLDGGGSTTLAFADTAPRVVNVPVGINNVPGSERANTTNLAVFADPKAHPSGSRFIFADFESGDEGTFSSAPGFSGSTFGINPAASSATAVNGDGYESGGAQRLVIRDDANTQGGWFVRHLSGPDASRAQNVIRPIDGFIGFWARTEDPGVEVAIAIDDSSDVTADRSMRKALIPDGQWHLYEWNLELDHEWEGWGNADGVLGLGDFTLDSIHLFGGDADAVVYLDTITHMTGGRLTGVPAIAGDLDSDGFVGIRDLNILLSKWGQAVPLGDRSRGDLAGKGDGKIGIDDLNLLLTYWNTGTLPGSQAGQLPVPEPVSAGILIALTMALRPHYPSAGFRART